MEGIIEKSMGNLPLYERRRYGPYTTVGTYTAHSKPMCMVKMNQRVLWRTLMFRVNLNSLESNLYGFCSNLIPI